jgi:signal transduction histidine kinase
MFRSLFRERQNRVIALTGIALSLSIALIAIVTLCLSLEDHRRHLYEREVSIIGRLVSLGVITHGDVPKILSEEGSEDYEAALELLKPFGYTEEPPDSFEFSDGAFRSKVIIITSLSTITLVIFWFSLLILVAKKQSDFLKETSLRLDALMSGRYDSESIYDGEGDAAILSAQLYALTRRLEKTMESVNFERDKMRGFISFISHELKTPLASLKTMNELLIEGREMERERMDEFLERSGEDIERMEWLIGDVLNIARIESGAIRFSFKKADLAELAKDVVRRYSEIAKSRGLKISVGAESTAMVFCDERWLSQALDNLVRNAVNYSPDGGTVSIDISRSEAYVCLTVADEGPGIAAGDAPKIFQSFYRGGPAVGSRKGTGLGLALAKAIIERHDGDIKLKSSNEKGSIFAIELPIREKG